MTIARPLHSFLSYTNREICCFTVRLQIRMSRKAVELLKNQRAADEQVQKIQRGATKNRLQELSKQSLDRLDRLNNVVRKWTCQHGKSIAVTDYRHHDHDDEGIADLLDHHEGLPALTRHEKASALTMSRDQNYNQELNDEIKLHMLSIDLKNRDKWEKDQLKMQTETSLDLYKKQQQLTVNLIQKIDETDKVLISEAQKRIEARRTLEHANIGAQTCYRELEALEKRQGEAIADLDRYITDITAETDVLKAYAKTGFEEDRRKVQLLMESQRLTEDNFDTLHGDEMDEMRDQMAIIKADFTRYDPMNRQKLLQYLRWQKANLRFQPMTYEKELLQSDIAIAKAQLKNIKSDVEFMQDRYVGLIYTEDPYTSEVELCM